MLNRTGPMFLLLLYFGQGCATNTSQLADADSGMAQSEKPESGTVSKGESAPAAGSAMRVYRDPVTGEFSSPPPEALPPSVLPSDREATSTAPLPEMQETAVEGGGMKLDLQGRFRNYMSVTKDAEGNATVQCNDKLHAHPHEHKASE